jgi:hypothetical protein
MSTINPHHFSDPHPLCMPNLRVRFLYLPPPLLLHRTLILRETFTLLVICTTHHRMLAQPQHLLRTLLPRPTRLLPARHQLNLASSQQDLLQIPRILYMPFQTMGDRLRNQYLATPY